MFPRVIFIASLLCLFSLSANAQCGSETTNFTFGNEVSGQEQQSIRNFVGSSVSFLCRKTNISTADSNVFAYGNFNSLITAYAEWFKIPESQARQHWGDNQATAISGPKVLFISTTSRGWLDAPPHVRLKIIIHEFFHILQFKLGGNEVFTLPRWFIEGTAEYVGFKGVDDAGLLSFNTARNDYVNQAKSMTATLDQASGFDQYVLGFLAVDFLLGNFDIAILAEVWRGNPAENFQRMFGRTVAEFTTQFEEHRRQGFPPPASIPESAPLLVTESRTMRAGAIDSVTFVRDPFPLNNFNNLTPADRRTRIILFARNIETGTPLVQGQNSQRTFTLIVEFVGKVPNVPELTQIVVKLPDNETGNIWLSLTLNGVTGNKAFISIKP